jgi:DNA-binding beta-propeller fold protein YncE
VKATRRIPKAIHSVAIGRSLVTASFAATLLVGAALAFGVSSAHASFEWLGVPEGAFARLGTPGELSDRAGGIAVDDTSGRVYIADGAHDRVTVFNARGGFIEAWTGGEGFTEAAGLAVDQTTGYVYVLDKARPSGVVQIFKPSGEFVSSFGVRGGLNQPVSKEPELIRSPSKAGIAVDDATGDVYLVDRNDNTPTESRVMVFKPTTPGDYSHYQYAGLANDITGQPFPLRVATDFAGNVYVSNEEAVFKYAAGDLTVPAWEHKDAKGVLGITVNPEKELVFYYTYLNNRLHELDSGGERVAEWKGAEIEEEVNGEPPRVILERFTESLAFNPSLIWSAGRPAGVLYAIDDKLNAGLIFVEPELREPTVESEYVSGVGTGAGTLGATLNAHGVDTHYVFQYGPAACAFDDGACIKEAPAPLEGDIGTSAEARVVTEGITGLAPDTAYHYRVVAYSFCHPPPEQLVKCVAEGADASFRTFAGGSGLSDGRVLELVSPPMKDGGEVFPLSEATAFCIECLPGVLKQRFPMQSTADGGTIAYEGDPFSATGGALSENEYLAVRGTGGWASRDLSPALLSKEAVRRAGYRALSSDLSRSVLYQIAPSLGGGAPEGYPDLYMQDTAGAGLTPLVTTAPANRSAGEFALDFAGGSSDFSHLAFAANAVLEAEGGLEAPGGAGENDLYEWVAGRLRVVNVLPDGTAEPAAELGSGDPNFSHVISADGSRIFWTDENHAHGHFGHVYVRENGKTTLEVPDGEGGAFLTASQDGSRVLLDDGRLYSVTDETVVEEADLTEGQRGFLGILGASEDLSHVYFVDTAALTGAQQNSQGATAQPGKDNLYLRDHGSSTFIGTLSEGDAATNLDGAGGMSDWSMSPSTRTAESTPDGSFVAFMSQAGLTGVDAGVFEVYEYDASTGGLVCASCNPTGESPTGPSVLRMMQVGSGFLPQPQNLSTNGRLFFDSYDELSPLDTNGHFDDVYEYEPNGLGTCARATGCVSLISPGNEAVNSSFVNATPSGSDVFFATASPLVPQDRDTLMDLYDARVGGTPPPPPPPPPCTGDECRTFSPSAPTGETLASTILTGSGNLIAPLPPPRPPQVHHPTLKERLAKALKACHRQHSKKKRKACEARARKAYRAAKNARSNASSDRRGR